MKYQVTNMSHRLGIHYCHTARHAMSSLSHNVTYVTNMSHSKGISYHCHLPQHHCEQIYWTSQIWVPRKFQNHPSGWKFHNITFNLTQIICFKKAGVRQSELPAPRQECSDIIPGDERLWRGILTDSNLLDWVLLHKTRTRAHYIPHPNSLKWKGQKY